MILDHLNSLTDLELIKIASRIRLKDCLNVLAKESGFPSWHLLKQKFDLIEKRKTVKGLKLYPHGSSRFLNHWFNNYKDAKNFKNENGGYLLFYGNQFFVCQSDYIENLGLDPNDSDWEKIEYDWFVPKEKDAWSRLNLKIRKE